jgi:hypothetical protein
MTALAATQITVTVSQCPWRDTHQTNQKPLFHRLPLLSQTFTLLFFGNPCQLSVLLTITIPQRGKKTTDPTLLPSRIRTLIRLNR